jgi:hypothetical protein
VSRRVRRDFRHARVRLEEAMSWGRPFRVRVSGPVYEGDVEAVVCVRRSDWERVTEREELVGRLRVGSRLPQYLVVVRMVT